MELTCARAPHVRYYAQRYRLFSRFDEGIVLDAEGWYSVTPERVAAHHAQRCACGTIVDAFCGAGGNTIQFAQTCRRVVAVDIDAARIRQAARNAAVYGVLDRIEFVLGDFLQLAPSLEADVVFLSPPWGGPAYRDVDVYDVRVDLSPPAGTIMDAARRITPHIAFYLPRNADPEQIALLAGPGARCEVEVNQLAGRPKAITAYYGSHFLGGED